jgi:hypothetical protein
MKTLWGSEGLASLFFTSVLDGGDWSVSRPGRLTFGDRAPGTHRIGGCVSPKGLFGRYGVEKNLILLQGTEPLSSSP